MRTTREWRRHPVHGHMLRGVPRPYPMNGAWCTAVTSLLMDNLPIELDPAAWSRQTSRLRVNAGCGQVAVDQQPEADCNPAFVLIDEGEVPEHIRLAFIDALGEP